MVKTLLCWLLAVFFLLAGIAHFTQTASFAAIVPPVLPFKHLIVQVTGAMELAFAVGLVVPSWRRVTGLALSAFLLAVLPANIHMAIVGMPLGEMSSPIALWFRVFLQFPLIVLVLWACGSLRRTA
ncbi:membrane protein [Algimonas arctica]|uniref:Membrane protein n=1 Tax=Algimonas arctica TaxID=1479486 RepID=A0A8J3CS79_9PROT|nr:DoxX family protein [Algimonas arctica]GHB04464.1 membrane protein [Algimonas arctica]